MENQETRALIQGALEDAKALVRLEIRLLKLEITSFGNASKRALVLCAVAALITVPALTLLLVAMALAIESNTDLEPWICYSIVAISTLAVALACILSAKRRMETSTKELLNGTRSRVPQIGNRRNPEVLTSQDR